MLRVDGGMVASDWTMQFLADILDAPVDRPKVLETTALGAAYLAGYRAGLYPPPADFAKSWKLDRRFAPRMNEHGARRQIRGLARRHSPHPLPRFLSAGHRPIYHILTIELFEPTGI